jgi:hypothetical protein
MDAMTGMLLAFVDEHVDEMSRLGLKNFLTCVFLGGAKGIRTPDLLDANESRYQLRHSP